MKPPAETAAPSPRRKARWWHVRPRVLLGPVVAYLIVLAAMMVFEEALIFHPLRYPAGEWRPVGLVFEDAEFAAEDGTRLHGWFVPHENPRAVVLFAPGNAGNITYRTDRLRRFQRAMGVAVLIFDYRGYGRSEGRPTERGVLADARAARRWLAERTGVAETDVVLLGESLGGGVMVDLAARDGARALILENTFTSLPDVAAWHYPVFPVRLLMRSRLSSLDKIAAYRGPLLQCHGDADAIVPCALGERLFAAANQPKRFVTLPGHDHNDPLPLAWHEAMNEFLNELPPLGHLREGD